MGIIDFRIRPPYKNYLPFFEMDGNAKFHYAYKYEMAESAKQRSMELLIKELDEAGIEKSVIPGRGFTGVTNEELFELSDKYPGRFIIFPYVNPRNEEEALRDIDRLIINGEGKGIAIEPELESIYGNNDHMYFNDERIDPIYRKLEQHKIPVMITFSGLITKYIDNTLPYRLDVLADKFPQLPIIVAHGGWPWTKELVFIAFKHSNVYLAPDFYSTNCPGADDYRQAAEYMLRDQFLYASSYPAAPLKESVDNIRNWKLSEESEQKVFYSNAAKLLGLT